MSEDWSQRGTKAWGMLPSSVWVDDEAREGTVLVGVASVHLPTVELDENLITHIKVQNDAVAGIVIVLVCILSNGAGPDLTRRGNDLLMV